jgi:cytoskeletal protein RodZ
MPQAIGDTLREARMRQKIDITEIEAKTKIRAKYLRAMENEEFDLLPGSTFAKSFLRTYADALGLDSHRLVEEYRAQYEPRDEGDLPPLAGQAGRRPPGRERRYDRRGPPRRTAAVLAVIVAAVAVLIVIGVFSSNNSPSKNASTTSTQPSKAKKHKKKSESSRGTSTPTRVSLRVTPTVPTYMCVDRGQGTTPVYQGITDQPQTFKGRHIRINLGKTSVTLSANGKHVALTQGPNPAGLDFTPGTHKDIPVGKRPCA